MDVLLSLGEIPLPFFRTECFEHQGLVVLASATEAVQMGPVPSCPRDLGAHCLAPLPWLSSLSSGLVLSLRGHFPVQVAAIQVEMELREEILPRAQNIQSRLDRQTIETEEVRMAQPSVGTGSWRHLARWPWPPLPLPPYLDFLSLPCLPLLLALGLSPPQVSKTLKATLQALLEGVTLEDGDALDSFQVSPSTESLKSTSSDPGVRQASRRRGQQQETETFYITVGSVWLGGQAGHRGGPELGLKLEALLGASQKLQEYLSGRSILAKLQAKHEKLQEAIQRGEPRSRSRWPLRPHPWARSSTCPQLSGLGAPPDPCSSLPREGGWHAGNDPAGVQPLSSPWPCCRPWSSGHTFLFAVH